METKFITREELEQNVRTHLKDCDLKDMKWFYAYFNEFEEFPLVLDEAAPGYKARRDHEEIPA
jgi:hypothetical protein